MKKELKRLALASVIGLTIITVGCEHRTESSSAPSTKQEEMQDQTDQKMMQKDDATKKNGDTNGPVNSDGTKSNQGMNGTPPSNKGNGGVSYSNTKAPCPGCNR